MPHQPGHLTPFSQSLINQGMNETNKIAANATNPPNMINQPYTTFSNNNNMNPVGGNVMGGPGFGPGSGMQGVGEGGTSSMLEEGTGSYYINPGAGLAFPGSMGGDAYDDYIESGEAAAAELMGQGIYTLPGGGYTIYDALNIYGSDILELANLNVGTVFSDTDDALSMITNLNALQQLHESGFYDTPPPAVGDPIEGLTGGFGNFDLGGLGAEGFSFNIGEGTSLFSDFFTDPAYQQTQIDLQQEAPTYTGGSMQATPLVSGARLARRLYYPGTTGGFSGVGSGIAGGNNTLQELLKGMG